MIGLALLYFQVLVVPNLTIMGVVPNIMLAFLVVLSLNATLMQTSILIFLLGLMQDITMPNLLGFNVFSYLILAMLVSDYHHSLDKNKMLSHVIILIIVNLLYYLLFFVVQLISVGYSSKLLPVVVLSVVYNTLLSVIILLCLNLIIRMKLTVHED